MTRIRLDYVHEFLDRHGRVRRYFRRSGFRQVPLPGLPGSAEFMEAYQTALAVGELRHEIGSAKSKPGTVAAAVAGYISSVDFNNLAANTKRGRRNILERFRQQHGDK